MKRLLLIGAAVAAVAIVACQQDTAPTAKPWAPPSTGARRDVGGAIDGELGVNFQGDYPDSASVDRAATILAAAGITHARIGVGWNVMEPSDTIFDSGALSQLHMKVSGLERHGITPYLSLNNSACFATDASPGCGSDHYERVPSSSAHWAQYKVYVRQIMQQFPELSYWGVSNEPNGGGLITSGSTLTDYEMLFDTTYAVAQFNSAFLIGPELGDGTDPNTGYDAPTWLSNFLSHDNSKVYIVAVHAYGAPSTSRADLVSLMAKYDTIVHTAGAHAIWLTEAGWNNSTPAEDTLSMTVDNILGGMVFKTYDSWGDEWGASFYYSAGNDTVHSPGDYRGLVNHLGTTGQVGRAAYDCFSWFGHWSIGYETTNPPPANCAFP